MSCNGRATNATGVCQLPIDTRAARCQSRVHLIFKDGVGKDRRIIVGSAEVGLSIEISCDRLLCEKQRLILDDLAPYSIFFQLFCRKRPSERQCSMEGCSLSASSLTQSSTLPCRSAAASGRSMRIKLEKTERSRDVKKGPHGGRFSIGSAP